MVQSGGMPADDHVRALAEQARGIPHSEEVLALLVRVKVINGAADLAKHVKGLTLRLHVLEKLCSIMRQSGYPGYGAGDVNSAARVAERLKERCTDRYCALYGRTAFVPDSVQNAVDCEDTSRASMMEGKAATPDDSAQEVTECFKVKRPLYNMVERSSEILLQLWSKQ